MRVLTALAVGATSLAWVACAGEGPITSSRFAALERRVARLEAARVVAGEDAGFRNNPDVQQNEPHPQWLMDHDAGASSASPSSACVQEVEESCRYVAATAQGKGPDGGFAWRNTRTLLAAAATSAGRACLARELVRCGNLARNARRWNERCEWMDKQLTPENTDAAFTEQIRRRIAAKRQAPAPDGGRERSAAAEMKRALASFQVACTAQFCRISGADVLTVERSRAVENAAGLIACATGVFVVRAGYEPPQ